MKKIATALSVLLALVIMISSMPTAGAVSSSAPYTYENSFLVTLKTEEIYGPYIVEQLKALLDVETCYIVDMEGIVYQLIVMNGDVPVEEDIERVKAIDGVVYAGRNKYAWDYAEHESSITLSQSHVEIPVGGTATLNIAETNLLYWMRQYRAACVKIQVYHEICSYEKFNTMMWDLKTKNNFQDLQWYALYEDDSQEEDGDLFLTINPSPEHENREVESPIGQYVVDFYSRNELEVLQLVGKLAENPNVSSARIVYQPLIGTPAPVEDWSVEDESVVTLTTDRGTGYGGTNRTATLQGNRVGQTVVQVARGYGNLLCYATCTVNVVEANPETPTDTPTDVTPTDGDVNGDKKVDAKDALEVLKYSVKKVEFTPLQMLAAEVDGKEGITAKDALEILKYAVKKIEKFPIEQEAVTLAA